VECRRFISGSTACADTGIAIKADVFGKPSGLATLTNVGNLVEDRLIFDSEKEHQQVFRAYLESATAISNSLALMLDSNGFLNVRGGCGAWALYFDYGDHIALLSWSIIDNVSGNDVSITAQAWIDSFQPDTWEEWQMIPRLLENWPLENHEILTTRIEAFHPNPIADEVLAKTRGILIWKHQVESILTAYGIPSVIARELTEDCSSWDAKNRLLSEIPADREQGHSLKSLLQERDVLKFWNHTEPDIPTTFMFWRWAKCRSNEDLFELPLFAAAIDKISVSDKFKTYRESLSTHFLKFLVRRYYEEAEKEKMEIF